MRLGGYQKMTLIDYPGKIATTVFTVGCSFRCSFCHNPELVLASRFASPDDTEEEFFSFLERRKGKLEGVCVTGGEPTIQPDILNFIKRIKDMGFSVKLDSNGTRPDVLKKIIDQKLVDYIAMDLKHVPEKYRDITGIDPDIERIKLSVRLIMSGKIDYEFRTTVVPGFHSEKDFDKIADWIRGAKRYYLQEFRSGVVLDPKLMEKAKKKSIDLEKIKKIIGKRVEKVEIRKNRD